MIIGGLEKLSLLDFPDHLAAIVFTSGCNFRCHYCYNPKLVLPKKKGKQIKEEEKDEEPGLISSEDLLLFLKERFGRLEGVVISGGEPTLHSDLPEFIKEIRKMGYAIKLDTNGTNPEMLKKLLEKKLLDYIAMDIKAGENDYGKTVGLETDTGKIKESIKIIINSGVLYEFRSTLVPGLVDKESFLGMGELIQGAKKWYLQNFKSDTNLVNPKYQNLESFSSQDMKEFVSLGKKFADLCEARSYT